MLPWQHDVSLNPGHYANKIGRIWKAKSVAHQFYFINNSSMMFFNYYESLIKIFSVDFFLNSGGGGTLRFFWNFPWKKEWIFLLGKRTRILSLSSIFHLTLIIQLRTALSAHGWELGNPPTAGTGLRIRQGGDLRGELDLASESSEREYGCSKPARRC